jgi:hypothetical protein
MKTDMRRKLAQQPFPQKIRKVGQLIHLAAKMKTERTTATSPQSPQRGNAAPLGR